MDEKVSLVEEMDGQEERRRKRTRKRKRKKLFFLSPKVSRLDITVPLQGTRSDSWTIVVVLEPFSLRELRS
jgi:hypothetical protein